MRTECNTIGNAGEGGLSRRQFIAGIAGLTVGMALSGPQRSVYANERELTDEEAKNDSTEPVSEAEAGSKDADSASDADANSAASGEDPPINDDSGNTEGGNTEKPNKPEDEDDPPITDDDGNTEEGNTDKPKPTPSNNHNRVPPQAGIETSEASNIVGMAIAAAGLGVAALKKFLKELFNEGKD